MSAWWLAHASAILSITLLAGLGCAALAEGFYPRRPLEVSPGTRWGQHFALTTLGFVMIRVCLPISSLAVAEWAARQPWGLFNLLHMPVWLQTAGALVAIDLGSYGVHRLFHAVPVLWRVHRVHHSDLDVDCGTAFRHHPLEALTSQAAQLALIMACGMAPLAVLGALVIGTLGDLFSHANLALPARADRLLGRLIVTPDLHRIHHSAQEAEGNRNFATVFSAWDRLFGTYLGVPQGTHERMDLGLSEQRNPAELSLLRLLVLPLRSPVPAVPSPTPTRCEAASASVLSS
jgi:sterol desaturase/sphingolipid hydroxylase (fatty acid hydroxylase superfamily)